MEDKEIYDLVDKKQIETFDRLDNTVKKQTEVFLYETQEIRKSINALTIKVGQQNGSIHELKEWKARCEGKEVGEIKAEEKKTKKMTKHIECDFCHELVKCKSYPFGDTGLDICEVCLKRFAKERT